MLIDKFKDDKAMFLGADIVDVDIIDKLIEGKQDLSEMFTEKELDSVKDFGQRRKIQSLAGKLAAKEAAAKAFGLGANDTIKLCDIEILSMESGKPFLILHNGAEQYALKIGIRSSLVSISHSHRHALATVILNK